jgi:methylglutaconyl-CoA hydratase
MISATEAQQIGLINTVVPAEALAETVDAFAQRLIVTNSANSMEMTKQMIATVQSLPLPEALTFASNMNAKARAHNDCIRGVNAFLNKEKITW